MHGRAVERAHREQSAYHRIFLCIHFCMIQEHRSHHCLFGYHISHKCRGTLQEINYNSIVQFYSGKRRLFSHSVSYELGLSFFLASKICIFKVSLCWGTYCLFIISLPFQVCFMRNYLKSIMSLQCTYPSKNFKVLQRSRRKMLCPRLLRVKLFHCTSFDMLLVIYEAF